MVRPEAGFSLAIFSHEATILSFVKYCFTEITRLHTSDFAANFSANSHFDGCELVNIAMNVHVRKHALNTFVVSQLVHIDQKEKLPKKSLV